MKAYERIIELYFKSMHRFNELEATPRDFGTGDLLYSSEIHTLQTIGKNANINLTELAEKMGISKSGASKFVKKLLQKQLITKSKQLSNKKEVVFNLTELGVTAFLGHEEFSKNMFASIHKILASLDNKEISFIESFLNALVTEAENLIN